MDSLREWIMGLTGAALISAVALTIAPEGKVKKVVALVCGLVTILALVAPIADLDYTVFAKSLAELRQEAEERSSEIGEEYDTLTRLIIEDECAAYILDKGTALGVDGLTVSVSAKWSEEGYWYPYKAVLSANTDTEHMENLAWYIEAELGIPSEEQYWSTENEE